MPKKGKKYQGAMAKVNADPQKKHTFADALQGVLDAAYARFDETIDIAVKLGVDPRHADQMVRGSLVLPHGTGKEVTVLVFAKGEKEKEALDAGADFVGNDDLVEKIKGGWTGFGKAVATPDVMGAVGKIGKILGPRGLMPNAKTGTVTFDVARAVKELKAGKIEFKVEKAGIIHAPVGKVSFGVEKLLANVSALMDSILRLKPATSKGSYIKSIALSSTMGPGFRVDPAFVKELLG